MSALIDTRATDLFVSEKVMSKLGLKDRKSIKMINMVNVKEVSTIGITQRMKLRSESGKTRKISR